MWLPTGDPLLHSWASRCARFDLCQHQCVKHMVLPQCGPSSPPPEWFTWRVSYLPRSDLFVCTRQAQAGTMKQGHHLQDNLADVWPSKGWIIWWLRKKKNMPKRQIFLSCVRGGFSEEAINPAKIWNLKYLAQWSSAVYSSGYNRQNNTKHRKNHYYAQ